MKIYEIYCECAADDAAHVEASPRFRNGHPSFEIGTITLVSSTLHEVGDADGRGARRLRGPTLPGEHPSDWDVLCGVCGAHIRRRELMS